MLILSNIFLDRLKWLALMLLLILACAAGAETAKEPEVSAFEEEEIFKNPVFANTGLLRIYWPRYDGIVTYSEDLCISLDSALTSDKIFRQFAVLSDQRLAVYNEQIQNPENIFGFLVIPYGQREKYVSAENAEILEILLPDFSVMKNGKVQLEYIDSLEPGRYYIISWAINKYGDIISSSPQVAFWLRAQD